MNIRTKNNNIRFICDAKVIAVFYTDLYKLIYIVVAEEINPYGEIDHMSSLSPEAATVTRNIR